MFLGYSLFQCLDYCIVGMVLAKTYLNKMLERESNTSVNSDREPSSVEDDSRSKDDTSRIEHAITE